MADVLRGLGYRVHPPTGRARAAACLLGQAALRARARGAARAPAPAGARAPRASAAASGRSGRTSGSSSPTRPVATRPPSRWSLRDGANRNGPPSAMAPIAGRRPKARGPTARGPIARIGPARMDRHATTAGVRARRAATPADRRCGSTPRRRRRARRSPIHPSPSCSSSSSAERNSPSRRCGSTNGSGMRVSSRPVRSPRVMSRRRAAGSTAGSPTSRTPTVAPGMVLTFALGPEGAGGADRGARRAPRAGDRSARVV